MSFLEIVRRLGAFCLLVGTLTDAAPAWQSSFKRTDNGTVSTGPLVFAHFMIGIVGLRSSPADYDDDMKRAKAIGIDAFALNIGVDPYTDEQLGYAYESAANNDMKVFISFDFNWFKATSDAETVGQKIANYSSLPGQLRVDGKAFASSFNGDGLDVATMRASAGVPVFWAPNYHPEQTPDPKDIDAGLNWMAWDHNGRNKAPNGFGNVTVAQGDASYLKWLGSKPYVAPVSPWFSTHYGPEVPYSKNWVFPGDDLWYKRWEEILVLQPRFVEIITWNDYGESHYIGPLSSTHYDDGNSKWTNDMPHDGWLDMAVPYIAALKAGKTSVTDQIKTDQLIYWHRPTAQSVDCDATDTTMVPANNDSGNYFMGRPDGHETMKDSVFVVSLLTEPGTVKVWSGNNSRVFRAPAGASIFEVPMGVGHQRFSLSRGFKEVFSGTSLKIISDSCVTCGLYNFNAYVGTLPAKPYEPLGEPALASLTVGLQVTTCLGIPSLGYGTAPTAAPTTTSPSETSPTDATSLIPTSSPAEVTTQPTITSAPAYTPTSTRSTLPTSTSSPPRPQICKAGTVAPGVSHNLEGLCRFACALGYCPPGPCVCTAYRSTGFKAAAAEGDAEPPADTGIKGCPVPGADEESSLGLCKFSCARGYCPEAACRTGVTC